MQHFFFFFLHSVTDLTKGGVDGEEEETATGREGQEVTDCPIVNSKSLFPPSLWRGRQEKRWKGGRKKKSFFFFHLRFISLEGQKSHN